MQTKPFLETDSFTCSEKFFRRLALLLNLAKDAIFVRNLNARVTCWNLGAQHLYGWSQEEALGKQAHIFLQTIFPRPLKEIEGILLKEGYWEGELIHATLDGRRIIVASRWSLERDEHGNPASILEVDSEITERRQATGEVIEANDYYLDLLGFTREEHEQGKEDWRAIMGPKWLGADDPVLLADAILPGPEEQIAAFALDLTDRKLAEGRLRKSEKAFQILAELVPQLIWISQPDGMHVYFNQRWVDYTGLTLEKSYGKGWDTPFHSDDKQPAWDAWNRAVATGAGYSINCRLRGGDGTYRWFLTRGQPLRDDAGCIVKWFGTCTDINDLKRTEEAARWLSAIVDGSQDAIIGATPEGTITSWNQGARRMLGYTSDEILDKSILLLIPPELLEQEAQIRARVQRGERVENYETLRRRKDGRLVDVSLTISPINEGAGHRIGISTIARDITESRRLTQAQARLSAIVDGSQDAIIGATPEGTITSWNQGARRMLGYTPDEILDKSILLLIPPELLEQEEQIRARVQRGERVENYETLRRHKDGRLVDVSLTISPINDAGGKLLGASKILRDITEQRRAEEKIHQLNVELEQRVTERTAQLEVALKEMAAFSYSVSHDLRAPIRAMDGYSRIMLEDYGEKVDEEGRRVLKIIRSEAKRMGDLVDDLLAFSRLSRGSMVSSEVDMTALAKSVFESMAAQEPDRKLQLFLRPLPVIQGELAMLRQVWTNLLSNAIKFTKGREVAQIEIGAESTDAEQIYYVKDNGAGFDIRFVGKLFGVFQRLHTDQEFPGTGVGLAIVQRVIARHGGRVWAEGKINEGATIYFAIPKAEI